MHAPLKTEIRSFCNGCDMLNQNDGTCRVSLQRYIHSIQGEMRRYLLRAAESVKHDRSESNAEQWIKRLAARVMGFNGQQTSVFSDSCGYAIVKGEHGTMTSAGFKGSNDGFIPRESLPTTRAKKVAHRPQHVMLAEEDVREEIKSLFKSVLDCMYNSEKIIRTIEFTHEGGIIFQFKRTAASQTEELYIDIDREHSGKYRALLGLHPKKGTCKEVQAWLEKVLQS